MDSIVLYGPGGASPLQLGTWFEAQTPVDYGQRDVLRPQLTGNPAGEGGVLGFEQAGIRHMTIPLLVGSHSAWGGMQTAESMLRLNARPGGFIDIQPEGVASAEAVRFDLLTGRWNPDYSLFLNRADRRAGSLELEVPPYGYWPTQIILASAASVGLPGVMTFAAPIGDAPALAEITIAPTSPSSYPVGTWPVDMLAWSVGGRPSFTSFWPAASLASAITGALVADQFAPGSQSLQLTLVATNPWTQAAFMDIPAVLEPAYRGRFRAFAFANLSPSYPWSVALDVSPQGVEHALASSGQVATLAPAVRGPMVGAASPAYTLLDMGELTMPPVASGLSQPLRVRLWADTSPSNTVAATLDLGGLFFLPLDGPAGVLPRGLTQPSVAPVGSVGRLHLSAIQKGVFIGAATGNIGSTSPLLDARLYYRGAIPRLGASSRSLQLLGGNRRLGAHPYFVDEVLSQDVRGYYRLDDVAGGSTLAPFYSPSYGGTGLATTASAGVPGGLWGGPENTGFFFSGSNNSWAVATGVNVGTAFTLFMVYKRASAHASAQMAAAIGSAPQGAFFSFDQNFLKAGVGAGVATSVSTYSIDASYHVAVLTFNASRIQLLVDGSVVGSAVGSWPGIGTTNLYLAGHRGFGGSLNYAGALGEVGVINGALTPSQAAGLSDAALSPTKGATTPLVRASETRAAVSITYRPRFQFLKGI